MRPWPGQATYMAACARVEASKGVYLERRRGRGDLTLRLLGVPFRRPLLLL
jgi:hypothetical protein